MFQRSKDTAPNSYRRGVLDAFTQLPGTPQANPPISPGRPRSPAAP
ncbi:hypothetical protein E2C01_054504 [Portunus trituberculatus]|uniref:Uncharacterized protein n=1 Tax=Portunus trituberculatus TaxID=210409 RepID=A0A5B7GS82_PORTR|nr:hypothetical protein [Portunus trituberculatus]